MLEEWSKEEQDLRYRYCIPNCIDAKIFLEAAKKCPHNCPWHDASDGCPDCTGRPRTSMEIDRTLPLLKVRRPSSPKPAPPPEPDTYWRVTPSHEEYPGLYKKWPLGYHMETCPDAADGKFCPKCTYLDCPFHHKDHYSETGCPECRKVRIQSTCRVM